MGAWAKDQSSKSQFSDGLLGSFEPDCVHEIIQGLNDGSVSRVESGDLFLAKRGEFVLFQ